MAWDNPKTDWMESSIPTAKDFNRIEQNIAFLNENKEASIDTLSIVKGGTGATTVIGIRKNLGLGETSGSLPIANGGTGAASSAMARANLGLGNASVLDILSSVVEQSGRKVATFKTYSSGSSGYLYLENGYLINWGTVYLSEDASADVTFPSASQQSLRYAMYAGRIAGTVVTGMISDGNGVYNRNFRNDVFVYGHYSDKLKIYNDGASGHAQWLVIGRKG